MILKYSETPQEVAQNIIEEVFVKLSNEQKLSIAVSGGSTPRLLFEMLALSENASRVNWDNILLFWVDERCVPPTDNESNFKMTKESLLDFVPIKPEQVFRIYGEAEPREEAERYTKLVTEQLATANGLPVFDVVILGIGDDGHTSSIFPTQMNLLEETTPYCVAQNPYTGQSRIALTGQTILNAKHLLFHSVGSAKAKILNAIIKQEECSKAYPSIFFFERREDVELFTDQKL